MGWRRPFLLGGIKRLQSTSTMLNTTNPLPLLWLYKLPASLSLLVPVARSIAFSSTRLCPARMCAAVANYSLADDCAEYLTKTLCPYALCPRSLPTPTSLSSPLTSCFVRAVVRRAVDVPKSLAGVFYMWRRATVVVPPRRVQARIASSQSTTPLELAQLVDDPLLQCAEPLSFVTVRHRSSSFVEAALYLLYCCEQGRRWCQIICYFLASMNISVYVSTIIFLF